MVLIVDLLLFLLLVVRGGKSECQTFGTEELSQFSQEGDIIIGGIFPFHQYPVKLNQTFRVNPGVIQCEG